MVRLREIETLTHAHDKALATVYSALAHVNARDTATFARRWRRIARRWDFADINELVDRHNRFYPAEARLPMDVHRGDFALVNGEPYTRRRLDAGWVLERYPARLAAALAQANGCLKASDTMALR
jgi:hypothetical protein